MIRNRLFRAINSDREGRRCDSFGCAGPAFNHLIVRWPWRHARYYCALHALSRRIPIDSVMFSDRDGVDNIIRRLYGRPGVRITYTHETRLRTVTRRLA